ncbi:hypothetical protein RHMOL_Rhmol05G0320300 [Rhododendron molle]|uniref:Uncharacterized protein n=1 Tax=Rhododendron molle TaxID=49168 RepID=A0ACC0NXJ7_RHOML|nr:hypothetical protein RHMOL_Rhmol05G0320300 [Rhododendron molle]
MNFLLGQVKDKPSTPRLENSQEITLFLQPDSKNQTLINCVGANPPTNRTNIGAINRDSHTCEI